MSVFDEILRTNLKPSDGRIAAFTYLNESARPEAGRVRALVDDLLERYPQAHLDALRRRLRSVDDVQHHSSFFELLVHELLLRAGCDIVAVEPPIEGTTRSPDFLVQSADNIQFYLEATLATGRSDADASGQRRLDDAIAAIDAVESPEFFLSVFTGDAPTQPLSHRRLRNRVQRWVDGLDYQAVVRAWELNGDGLPQLVHEEHGARLRIEPVPRERSRGERGQPAVGLIGMDEVIAVQTHISIRKAVEGKAGRYGDLDLPYVIAVNSLAPFSLDHHALDALLGTEAVEVSADGGVRHVRNPDGAWRGPQGPRNTRVSAVLYAQGITPWNLARTRASVIINPWARRPFEPPPGPGHGAQSIGELLGLAPEWPISG